jgi:hypothetical protein
MTTYPKITYDAAADAVAIILSPTPRGKHPVTRALDANVPQLRGDFIGTQLVAFEILDASSLIDPKALSQYGSSVEWLILEDAAKEAKRALVTIRQAAAAGRIEGAEKRGRDWFIPRAGLWNYLETLAPAGRPPANRRAPQARRTKAPTR